MRTKIYLLMLVFTSMVINTNAQVKVYTGNAVSIGSTTAPPSGYELQVTGNSLFSGNMGIGTTSPSSKLSIGGAGNTKYGEYIYNSSTANASIGLYATNVAIGTGYYNYGIYGFDTSGYAGNQGAVAYGVYGYASKTAASTYGKQYGVYGNAGNATSGYNYGVYGMLSGSNNGAGVYGTINSKGDTLVPGQYAGYFRGNFRVANSTAEKYGSTTWTVVSDSRLKTNITPFQDGLNIIRKINPVNYKYNGMGGLPTGNSFIGVIAQQVQSVAPYCVGKSKLVLNSTEAANFSSDIIATITDTNGTKNIVNVYNFSQDGLFYAMLNSIKQLDSTTTALQKQINANKQFDSTTIVNLQKQFNTTTTSLQQQINNCCTTGSLKGIRSTDSTNQTSGINSNNESVANSVLYQNNPNPFSVSTTINYFLDEKATNAAIYIFDMQGTLLKTINLTTTGKGNIVINGGELNAGMYMYSLVANGKEIDTKRMILTK
jgi:hypothetical protein